MSLSRGRHARPRNDRAPARHTTQPETAQPPASLPPFTAPSAAPAAPGPVRYPAPTQLFAAASTAQAPRGRRGLLALLRKGGDAA